MRTSILCLAAALLPALTFAQAIVTKDASPGSRNIRVVYHCDSSRDAIKAAFNSGGVALSAYESELIRLSLPARKLAAPDFTSLESGFAHAEGIIAKASPATH